MATRVTYVINSFVAGIAISLGCIVYLSCENKIVGSFMFSIGLLIVLLMKLNLYTGKVGYAFSGNKEFNTCLPLVWGGNGLGAIFTALLIRQTRYADKLIDLAKPIVETKLNDSLLSLFILGVFCNILIYLAVDVYNKNEHKIAKYLGIILFVSTFVICGFEHCIADVFYFCLVNVEGSAPLICTLAITIGNTVGGLSIPVVQKMINWLLILDRENTFKNL